MKVKYAKEKSEYSYRLWKCVEPSTSNDERIKNYNRLKQLESFFKSQDDEVEIIVTTRDTFEGKCAPPMTMEKIKND